MVEDGRLESLDIAPQSLLLAPEKLATHVLAAVNVALEDLAARSAGETPVPLIDPLTIARQMRELREDIGARMWIVTDSMRASADRLRQEADVDSDVPVMDFRYAFDQVIDLLETIGGIPDDAEGLLGEGLAARDLVRVRCGPRPRLVAVTIDQRAMRTTSELSGYLVEAANQAMDVLAAKLREHRRGAGADPDLVEARIHELQESGITQMRSYGERLSTFMGSVRLRQ